MGNQEKNLPVNWIDGMKVNKNHFISTDHAVAGKLQAVNASFITPFNYGLLSRKWGGEAPVKIISDIDGQGYIHVKVMNCSAITRDGSGIEIEEAAFLDEELSAAMPQIRMAQEAVSEKEYLVCLTVNLFERVPYGKPDPEETPPRLPFVLPGYHLSLHRPEEKNSILTGNSFIIGRLVFIDGKPELDDNYIPACRALDSHPKLVDYHAQLLKVLGQMEIDVVNILQGIKNKKQGTPIAGTVAEVSNAVLQFLGVHLVEFRKIARYQPPVYIFEQMAALARIIHNTINTQSAADREELFNYIQDWSGLKQGEFEALLLNAVEYAYDHDDINHSIEELAPFVNVISKLFNTLSNLDFIGKRKDRQIFVKEQKQKPGNSFLVD